MANPIIISTTTRWADDTHISVNMTFANGSGTVIIFQGSNQKWSDSITSGATKTATFTGIDKDNTYRIEYLVTSSSLSATKWDELIGATPVISTHPNGGVGLGVKASEGEFRTRYDAFFDGYAKFNAELLTMNGIYGPIDGRRYDPTDPLSTRSLLTVLPFLTYEDVGVSAGAADSEVSNFLKAWSLYIAGTYPNLEGFVTAIAQPDCNLLILYETGGNYDLVGGIPRYSVGWALPSFNDARMFKFGTYNGTWFCYKFAGTAV